MVTLTQHMAQHYLTRLGYYDYSLGLIFLKALHPVFHAPHSNTLDWRSAK